VFKIRRGHNSRSGRWVELRTQKSRSSQILFPKSRRKQAVSRTLRRYTSEELLRYTRRGYVYRGHFVA
jgi:hypothetical protein